MKKILFCLLVFITLSIFGQPYLLQGTWITSNDNGIVKVFKFEDLYTCVVGAVIDGNELTFNASFYLETNFLYIKLSESSIFLYEILRLDNRILKLKQGNNVLIFYRKCEE